VDVPFVGIFIGPTFEVIVKSFYLFYFEVLESNRIQVNSMWN